MNSKISQIFSVYYMLVHDAIISETIGVNSIKISGTWKKIPMSSAELKESSLNGDMSSQEISIKVTDSSSSSETIINDIAQKLIILKLDYTDGVSKIIGNENHPVVLTKSKEGSPQYFLLSMKRDTPEISKLLTT